VGPQLQEAGVKPKLPLLLVLEQDSLDRGQYEVTHSSNARAPALLPEPRQSLPLGAATASLLWVSVVLAWHAGASSRGATAVPALAAVLLEHSFRRRTASPFLAPGWLWAAPELFPQTALPAFPCPALPCCVSLAHTGPRHGCLPCAAAPAELHAVLPAVQAALTSLRARAYKPFVLKDLGGAHLSREQAAMVSYQLALG
jgi:hypothetical protein